MGITDKCTARFLLLYSKATFFFLTGAAFFLAEAMAVRRAMANSSRTIFSMLRFARPAAGFQIRTGSPAKHEDFQSVVDNHAWRGTLLQYYSICELLQRCFVLAGAANGLRLHYWQCCRVDGSPACLEHALLMVISDLFGINIALL